MAGDTEPRAEFTEPLREWFVDELRRPTVDGADVRSEPRALPSAVRPSGDRDGRSRRRWSLLVNAAAVVGLVAGLWWLGSESGEPTTDPPVASAPVPGEDPVAVAREVCEDFRVDAPSLAMGASPAEVEQAAADVRARLVAAVARLGEAPNAVGLAESRRLGEEAIEASDRLLAVVDGDRPSIDSAVENLDLIIVAWGRELATVAGEACVALPTLREVF